MVGRGKQHCYCYSQTIDYSQPDVAFGGLVHLLVLGKVLRFVSPRLHNSIAGGFHKGFEGFKAEISFSWSSLWKGTS